MTVATVSAGYGDGYPRSQSGKGYVLIRGRRAAILGRVCMDQMIVDVSGIPEAREGDMEISRYRWRNWQISAVAFTMRLSVTSERGCREFT